MSVLLRADS
jgi:ubiquitin-like 1-activating enzyme E1 A